MINFGILPYQFREAILEYSEHEERLKLLKTNKILRLYILSNGPYPSTILDYSFTLNGDYHANCIISYTSRHEERLVFRKGMIHFDNPLPNHGIVNDPKWFCLNKIKRCKSLSINFSVEMNLNVYNDSIYPFFEDSKLLPLVKNLADLKLYCDFEVSTILLKSFRPKVYQKAQLDLGLIGSENEQQNRFADWFLETEMLDDCQIISWNTWGPVNLQKFLKKGVDFLIYQDLKVEKFKKLLKELPKNGIPRDRPTCIGLSLTKSSRISYPWIQEERIDFLETYFTGMVSILPVEVVLTPDSSKKEIQEASSRFVTIFGDSCLLFNFESMWSWPDRPTVPETLDFYLRFGKTITENQQECYCLASYQGEPERLEVLIKFVPITSDRKVSLR